MNLYIKQYYRDKVKEEFTRLSATEIEERSITLVRKLLSECSFQQAKTVMAYLPLKDEANIRGVFREEKKFCIPMIKNDLIVPVEFSSNEAIKIEDIDLVVVPGRAFTKGGTRIGRGLGFYDRFLATLPENIPTISLAFNFQIFTDLPQEEHDVSIDKVIAENNY